jgi:hypothetical protein
MERPDDPAASAGRLAGVLVPLVVLAVALVRVDPALLGRTALALGVALGVAVAYARYVDLDAGCDGGAEASDPEPPAFDR